MVPEIIRWQTPLSYMRRTATRDCDARRQAHPETRPAADVVRVGQPGRGRLRERGRALDIERPNASRHLSFGYGVHFCMGSRLAELQLRVLWDEILRRFERIEVQAEPSRTYSSFVKGYTRLPVVVKRK